MSDETVTLRHRPLIDGFRGLMILATLAYHLDGWTSTPGGWVGVSGFFVLSGYLITSLLVAEQHRTGGVSLRRFYERRLRRLAPALLVVIAGTTIAVALLGGVETFPTYRGDALATIFYVANWRFILDAQSYFTSFSPSPLRHAWSLAIEEQFYIVWPLAISAGVRFLGRRRLAAALVFVAIASASWMTWLASTGDDLSRAYYGTASRAQELVVGALLALFVAASRDDLKVQRAAEWIGLAGLVAFVGAWLFVPADQSWPYVGGGFLVIAVASALLIYGCARSDGGLLAPILGNAPMRALGARSYVLYLVHWPVIVLMASARPGWSPWVLDVAAVALSFAITEVIHRGIERPIHRRRWALPRPGGLLLGGATATIVLVLATTVVPAGQRRGPVEGGEVIAAANPEAEVEPGQTVPPPDPGDRVVVLGDSQGWILLDNVPTGFDLHVSGTHHARCDIIGEVVYTGSQTNEQEKTCPKWPLSWAQALEPGADAVVVTLGLRQLYDLAEDGERIEVGTPRWERRYRLAVRHALEIIRDFTDAPIVWLDVPCFQWSESDSDGEEQDPERLDTVNEVLADELAGDGNATVAPYRRRVCTGPDHSDPDLTLRPDGAHLSDAEARKTWVWLEKQVRAAQARATEGPR